MVPLRAKADCWMRLDPTTRNLKGKFAIRSATQVSKTNRRLYWAKAENNCVFGCAGESK
jgi:hypothetical protein